jgi:purine-binding chemotaxis protein CheW
MAEATLPTGHGDARLVLEQRARALARPLAAEEPEGTVDLVVVVISSERYGIDLARVREVQPLSDLTPVPGVPPWWAGVVNVRGMLYAVLDPRARLALPAGEPAGEPKVVLVRDDRLCVGLLVDDAPAVRRVPAQEVRPPLAGTPDAVRPVVRGVTADLLTILDVEAMLRDPSLAVRHEQTEGAVQR